MPASPVRKPSILSRGRIVVLILAPVLMGLAVLFGLSSALARNDNSAVHPTTSNSTTISNTTDVSIIDFGFQPNVVTITVGSSVTWTNTGTFTHTVTSDTGLWDSKDIGPGHTFTETFNAPGKYPYHCMHHPIMTGTVVVEAKIYLPISFK